MKKIIFFLICACSAFVMGTAQVGEGRIEYFDCPTLRGQNLTFSLQDHNLVISGHILADRCEKHFLGYKLFEDSVYLYRIDEKGDFPCSGNGAHPVNLKIGNCPGDSYKICLAEQNAYPGLDLVVSRKSSSPECLPANGAEWVLSIVSWDDRNFETNRGMMVLKMAGDTLMNGKTYHKLYFYDWPGHYIETPPPPFREACALRMEGKKVWATFDEGEHENLIYDFEANVGDTIWHGKYEMNYVFPSFYPDAENFSVVESVQTTPNGRELHVTTYAYRGAGDLERMGDDVWIDGVGSLYGFGGYYIPQTTCGSSYKRKLWKLTENGTLVYPKVDPGILPHALSSVESVSLEIKYDPSSEELSVQSDETAYPCQLEIVNIQGTVMRSCILFENTSLSVHELTTGIYICSVLKGGKSIKTERIRK